MAAGQREMRRIREKVSRSASETPIIRPRRTVRHGQALWKRSSLRTAERSHRSRLLLPLNGAAYRAMPKPRSGTRIWFLDTSVMRVKKEKKESGGWVQIPVSEQPQCERTCSTPCARCGCFPRRRPRPAGSKRQPTSTRKKSCRAPNACLIWTRFDLLPHTRRLHPHCA